nr:Putative uncharacterized protein [Moritella viscosa]
MEDNVRSSTLSRSGKSRNTALIEHHKVSPPQEGTCCA